MFWTVLYIGSSYQGLRHGHLFLNLCGSSSFPHIDLGSTLVQDVAVLKQSGIKVVTAAQDHGKAFPQGLPLKPGLATLNHAHPHSTYIVVQQVLDQRPCCYLCDRQLPG